MKESSVCYLIKANKVLRLYRNKKINDVNHGKWIGIGGKKKKMNLFCNVLNVKYMKKVVIKQ